MRLEAWLIGGLMLLATIAVVSAYLGGDGDRGGESSAQLERSEADASLQ